MRPRRITVRPIATAVMALAMFTALTLPALAGGSVVTRGDFKTFADGTGDIGGHAQMVRRGNGTTKVKIHITGLDPGEEYVSHVHLQSCDDGNAGGHFKQNPAGAGEPPNEIWPGNGKFSPSGGGIANQQATVGYFAGPMAISVVVHLVVGGQPSAKIACADLG